MRYSIIRSFYARIIILFLPLFSFVTPPLIDVSTADIAMEDDIPIEAHIAAQEGLHIFLRAIPGPELTDFGFSSQTEIERASLGSPFRAYTIPYETLAAYTGEQKTLQMIVPMNTVIFPVLVDEQPRTSLTVNLIEGSWKAISLGGGRLAKQAANLKSLYPTTEGYALKYLTIPANSSHFMIVESNQSKQQSSTEQSLDATIIVPFPATSVKLGYSNQKPCNPAEIFSRERNIILKMNQ